MKKIILVMGVFASLWIASHPAHAALCAAGDKAQVLWKGTWYPATVVKVKENQCFIHYDGYGKNWDEWVGADRIKILKASAAPKEKEKL